MALTVPILSPAILTSPPLTIWLAVMNRACTTYESWPPRTTTASTATPTTSAATATARPDLITLPVPPDSGAAIGHGTPVLGERQTRTGAFRHRLRSSGAPGRGRRRTRRR